MKSRVTFFNMLTALLLQLFTIISGFIIPRIILNQFGSNVNGLVSSLSQFLSYITLIEGGITGVVNANLYKPIVSKDYNKLSSVLVTARQFFFKIGLIYVLYSLVLAVLYPLVSHMEFGFVFTLTLILSITSLIQYLFSLSLQVLLIADKKGYIVNSTQMLIIVLNVVLVYCSVKIYPSIHLLKLIIGIVYILQPIMLWIYIQKNYSLDWKAKPDSSLLKERWNGFAINLAAFIHGSTDVSILTIFANLYMVSVYSVYSMVVSGLKRLISALTAGINPVIGQAYAKGDMDELNEKLDLYEYIVFIIVFFFFVISGLLITPFVLLYTKGITDTNYNQPVFGYIFVLSEAVYLIKLPHLNFAYSANKYKDITSAAYIEAILNIIISIILVKPFGLVGVAIGTLVAMIYRMVFHVYYSSTQITGRVQSIFYRKLLMFIVASVIGIVFCRMLLPMNRLDMMYWIIRASEYSLVFIFLYGILSIMFFKKEFGFLINYMMQKKVIKE